MVKEMIKNNNRKKIIVNRNLVNQGLKLFLVFACITAAVSAYAYVESDSFDENGYDRMEITEILQLTGAFNLIKGDAGTTGPQSLVTGVFNLIKGDAGTTGPQSLLTGVFNLIKGDAGTTGPQTAIIV